MKSNKNTLTWLLIIDFIIYILSLVVINVIEIINYNRGTILYKIMPIDDSYIKKYQVISLISLIVMISTVIIMIALVIIKLVIDKKVSKKSEVQLENNDLESSINTNEKYKFIKIFRNCFLEIIFGLILILITYIYSENILMTFNIGSILFWLNIIGFTLRKEISPFIKKISKYSILFSIFILATYFIIMILFIQYSISVSNEYLVKLFSTLILSLGLFSIYILGAIVISLEDRWLIIPSRIVFGISSLFISIFCVFYLHLVKDFYIHNHLFYYKQIEYLINFSLSLFIISIDGLTHFNKKAVRNKSPY